MKKVKRYPPVILGDGVMKLLTISQVGAVVSAAVTRVMRAAKRESRARLDFAIIVWFVLVLHLSRSDVAARIKRECINRCGMAWKQREAGSTLSGYCRHAIYFGALVSAPD